MEYELFAKLIAAKEGKIKSLTSELTMLFKTFRTSNKDYSELIQVLAFVGSDIEDAKLERNQYTPPAEQRKKVAKYKKSLEAARIAFHEIPKGLFCSTDEYDELEPVSVSREITQNKEAGIQTLTITRPESRPAPDYWLAELDLLTILIEDAERMVESSMEVVKPDFFLPVIRRVALHCRKFGIKPSHAEDSQFYRIVATLLPSLSDPRPVIRKAIMTI